MSTRSRLFAWLAFGPGLIFSLVGLWGRIVGESYVGFALVFGCATLVLGAIALWLHRRWARLQESAGPDQDSAREGVIN